MSLWGAKEDRGHPLQERVESTELRLEGRQVGGLVVHHCFEHGELLRLHDRFPDEGKTGCGILRIPSVVDRLQEMRVVGRQRTQWTFETVESPEFIDELQVAPVDGSKGTEICPGGLGLNVAR